LSQIKKFNNPIVVDHTVILMMVAIAIKTIYLNVIKQLATTVPLLTRFVWQIHHIVYRLMVKIVSKIQESFVITQETHLHGVIFMIVQVIVQQLMGKHATIHGRECI
jgi:hypothetical protein